MTQSAELLTKTSRFKPGSYPDTPFNRAKAEWNNLVGGLVKSAFSWRSSTFLCLIIIGGMAYGLVHQSMQSTVKPYYIEVLPSGENVVRGEVSSNFTPNENQIRYSLNEWITWVRGISLDPVLVKADFKKALGRMRQSSANTLNDWARADTRFLKVGRETVAIPIINIIKIKGTNSYSARWTEEHRNSDGTKKEALPQTWTATFMLEFEEPNTEKTISINPIGLYIKDFQWQQDR